MSRFKVLALAASLFLLPLGANAQSTQTITVTWPSTPLTDKNFINSNPFADFNPSLGTLTTYSLTVSGSGTSTDDIFDIGPPELVFEAPGSTDALVVHTASDFFSFSASGSFNDSATLSAITGTGQSQFLLADFSQPPGSTSVNFTNSYVTYTYTPVPEPTSLCLFGIVAVGLLRPRQRTWVLG